MCNSAGSLRWCCAVTAPSKAQSVFCWHFSLFLVSLISHNVLTVWAQHQQIKRRLVIFPQDHIFCFFVQPLYQQLHDDKKHLTTSQTPVSRLTSSSKPFLLAALHRLHPVHGSVKEAGVWFSVLSALLPCRVFDLISGLTAVYSRYCRS